MITKNNTICKININLIFYFFRNFVIHLFISYWSSINLSNNKYSLISLEFIEY